MSSELFDDFDPPLFSRSNLSASLIESENSITAFEQKLRQDNPNYMSGGFKLKSKSESTINEQKSEVNKTRESFDYN